MSTPVSSVSTTFNLGGVQTEKPVVSGGWSRWSEELSFLLGHDLHNVGGAHITWRPAGRTSLLGLTTTVRIPYCRSPGAHIVRVLATLHQSDERTSQTITVTLPTGATWLDAQGLDGSFNFPNSPTGRTNPEELVGWVDVSGVDETDLTLEFAFKSTPLDAKAVGIQRCSVVEVPRAAFPSTATEPVLDAASTRPGRLVVEGGSGVTSGGERMFYELDRARAEMREHFCFAGVESSDATAAAVTPHWYRETASYGAIDFLQQHDVVLFLRPRRLYRGDVATAWRLRIRYRTSNGTACALKLYAEAGTISGTTYLWTAGVAAVAQTVALAGTTGVWAWVDANVTIPGDATDQTVKVWFEAQGPGAAQLLSIATIALIEKEP